MDPGGGFWGKGKGERSGHFAVEAADDVLNIRRIEVGDCGRKG